MRKDCILEGRTQNLSQNWTYWDQGLWANVPQTAWDCQHMSQTLNYGQALAKTLPPTDRKMRSKRGLPLGKPLPALLRCQGQQWGRTPGSVLLLTMLREPALNSTSLCPSLLSPSWCKALFISQRLNTDHFSFFASVSPGDQAIHTLDDTEDCPVTHSLSLLQLSSRGNLGRTKAQAEPRGGQWLGDFQNQSDFLSQRRTPPEEMRGNGMASSTSDFVPHLSHCFPSHSWDLSVTRGPSLLPPESWMISPL